MRGNELLDKMELIDPFYVEAADVMPTANKRKYFRWGIMAASLCLIVWGIFLWGQTSSPNIRKESGVTVSENGVNIPKTDLSADMEAFFIYQGRCYVLCGAINNDKSVVGEFLGTATGRINEWTPQDGYVEFAGSVQGDFYAVTGYDPSFMLCITWEKTDRVEFYICTTGITLKYGSELYEDRLHLSGNYNEVLYESSTSFYPGKDEIFQLQNSDVILDFIEQINAATFIPCDSLPLKDGQTSIFDTEQYHLYFKMNHVMEIHLRLFENGYVRFEGLPDLCLQISKESYDALLNLLNS